MKGNAPKQYVSEGPVARDVLNDVIPSGCRDRNGHGGMGGTREKRTQASQAITTRIVWCVVYATTTLHPLVSDILLTLPPNHAPSDVYPIVALQIPHYSTSRTELGTRTASDVTEHEYYL